MAEYLIIDREIKDTTDKSVTVRDRKRYHDFTLEEAIDCDNLAEYIDPEDLKLLGQTFLQYFKDDTASREGLDELLKQEAELVMLISKHKTFPFEGASNVKFPLTTVAVLQYTSRAQAAIYNNGRLVEAKLPSAADKRDPVKMEACKAVERDIAFELLNKTPNWDEGMRKVFIAQGTSGNVYKKVYFNPATKRVQSDVCFADKLIFDAKSINLSTAPRISEIVSYNCNDVYSRVAMGEWVDPTDSDEDSPDILTPLDQALNDRHGIEKAVNTPIDPHHYIEMYTYYDLDNDGYQEPIVVTFRRSDGCITRIVANFSYDDIHRNKKKGNALVSIDKEVTFIKYGFIPSPNESIYDFGYGRLLFSMNAAANTSVNQILDIGKWAACGGAGLIDSRLGAQLGGKMYLAPGERKQSKIMDIDMNKAIWNMPIPQVPPELMSMLSFLVQYSDRVSGSTEARSGENMGQNTKVGTVEALVEEGAAIFNGVYRATRHAFSQEIRAIFRLKKRYFPLLDRSVDEKEIASESQYNMISDLDPACSLQYISERDRLRKATTALQTAANFPAAHKMYNVLKDYYDAQDPDMADRYLIHDPKSSSGLPEAPNPKAQIEQGKMQIKQQELQVKQQEAQQSAQMDMQELQMKGAKTQAEIEVLKAQAIEIIEGLKDKDVGHQIAMLDAVIGLQKHKDSHVLDTLKTMKDLQDVGSTNGNTGMGTGPDDSTSSSTPDGVENNSSGGDR